ncbi:hypothetical protein TNCV_4163261 [Trichonephila clavipes]|nr:hypothetical protein TNCV_4163261 [Trichonephila clavipes]
MATILSIRTERNGLPYSCEVEGTIASPLSIPLERAMSPTGERRDEGRNIRTKQNPLGPQERQTRISKAKIQRVKTGGPSTLQRRNRQRKPQRRNRQRKPQRRNHQR